MFSKRGNIPEALTLKASSNQVAQKSLMGVTIMGVLENNEKN